MGYETNTKAYKLILKIEVGIREYFISIITQEGIFDWYYNFLGKIQQDTLQVISQRISHSKETGETPSIADIYLFKLNRASKDINNSLNHLQLFHPFYYLNWTDLENLISTKSNSVMFERHLGKSKRDSLRASLSDLNLLRNDIAHSRFISTDEYNYLKGSYKKIKTLIPNFESLINHQNTELRPRDLIVSLKKLLEEILDKDKLDNTIIEEIINVNDACINSFWLNSFNIDLVKSLKRLSILIDDYKLFRNQIGGLLQIQNWKSTNANFILEIKRNIDEQVRNKSI